MIAITTIGPEVGSEIDPVSLLLIKMSISTPKHNRIIVKAITVIRMLNFLTP